MSAGSALAADVPTPVLNPEPPDYYTCLTNGAGTHCFGQLVEPYGPDPTGLFCGAGPEGFEVLDQAVRILDQDRWYDRTGNIVRRKKVISFQDARLSGPHGVSVSYVQRDIERIAFPTPGDTDVAIDDINTSLRIVVPGQGAVLMEKGRQEYGTDGELLKDAGRHDVEDYFAGDTGALAGLCRALGAP
ncbi:hypothetical protein GCM10009845_16070 [Pedococcus bigeumensis]